LGVSGGVAHPTLNAEQTGSNDGEGFAKRGREEKQGPVRTIEQGSIETPNHWGRGKGEYRYRLGKKSPKGSHGETRLRKKARKPLLGRVICF